MAPPTQALAAVIGYLISSNMSKTAHAGNEPTFYFHDYETNN